MPADNKGPKQVKIEFHLMKLCGTSPYRAMNLMESFALGKGGYNTATLQKA